MIFNQNVGKSQARNMNKGINIPETVFYFLKNEFSTPYPKAVHLIIYNKISRLNIETTPVKGNKKAFNGKEFNNNMIFHIFSLNKL